ncbi:MAG: TonB-dependent receptor [Desulfovibrio sp.]|nr:TonB-dependent receptor [Desulfovibrio sp.]
MINFVPKKMTKEGYEIRLGFQGGSFGTIAENIGLGAKKDNVDIYAAQSLISTLGHDDHTAANQRSYYVNTGMQLSDNWEVRLMANKVDAETQSPNNPWDESTYWQNIERFQTNSHLMTFALNNTYDKAHGFLKAYYNDTQFYLRGENFSTPSNRATSNQSILMYGLRGRETFNPWDGGEILVGFDLDAINLHNSQRTWQTDTTTDWDFPFQTVFSPYIAASHTFGDKDAFHLTPSAGIRYNNNSVFRDALSPQAGIVLGYGNTNLAFNYARGVNYPSPVVLQGFLQNKDLPGWLDTKDIKPEIVDHYEVSLSHNQPDLFSVSATYFHDDGRNRLRACMTPMAMMQPATTSFFTSSIAKYTIDGLELAGSVKPLDNLELFAGATWLWAKAKGDDDKTREEVPYTPSFALQAGFTWDFLEHFRLSGDFQHLRNVYDATYMRGSTQKGTSNFQKLTDNDRLPDSSVLNLRLDYLFKCDSLHIEEGKLFVAVNNVLNSPYAYSLEKSGDGSDRKLYYMPGTSAMVGFDVTF